MRNISSTVNALGRVSATSYVATAAGGWTRERDGQSRALGTEDVRLELIEAALAGLEESDDSAAPDLTELSIPQALLLRAIFTLGGTLSVASAQPAPVTANDLRGFFDDARNRELMSRIFDLDATSGLSLLSEPGTLPAALATLVGLGAVEVSGPVSGNPTVRLLPVGEWLGEFLVNPDETVLLAAGEPSEAGRVEALIIKRRGGAILARFSSSERSVAFWNLSTTGAREVVDWIRSEASQCRELSALDAAGDEDDDDQ